MNTYLDYKKYLFYRLPSTIYAFLELEPGTIVTSSDAYAMAIDAPAVTLQGTAITMSTNLSYDVTETVDIIFNTINYINSSFDLDTIDSINLQYLDTIITDNSIRIVRVDIMSLDNVMENLVIDSHVDLSAYEILEMTMIDYVRTSAIINVNTAELVDINETFSDITFGHSLVVNMADTLDINSVNGIIELDSSVFADKLIANQLPALYPSGDIAITIPNITLTVTTVRDRYSNTDEFLGLFTADLLNMTVSDLLEISY